ncbi:MAG: hypothetical protein NTV93_05575 [Verrucomicrobia bacterium]|nr:hypothetical protein [Verrucomicrobiota bacterium]
MRTAHACRRAGMHPDQATREIESRITRRPDPSNEIPQAVAKAFNSAPANGATGSRVWATAPKWPVVNQEQREAVIASGLGLVDLWEASPVRWEDSDQHTEEIVDAMFPGNPLLCVGQSKSRFATRHRESFRGRLAGCQLIVPSPMFSRTGRTQDGKESEHALSNTGNRRFLVIEQDSGTPDEQAAVLLHLATSAPLVLAVHSGSKSIHGWFFCSGHPEDRLHGYMRRAVTLGADPRMWTRSQFARMPDGTRDNGNRQTVYFFNPQAITQ